MARPESVLAMHKSYFCLHYLHDVKLAIDVALEHLKHCADTDLILTVLMEFLANHKSQAQPLELNTVRGVFVELLKSRNIVGLHRILVRHQYEHLMRQLNYRRVSDRRLEILPSKALGVGPYRIHAVRRRVSRHRANLSISRITLVQRSLESIERKRYAVVRSPKQYSVNRPTKRSCHGNADTLEKEFQRNLIDCFGDKALMYYRCDMVHGPRMCKGGDYAPSVAGTDVPASGRSSNSESDGCCARGVHDRQDTFTKRLKSYHGCLCVPIPTSSRQLCVSADRSSAMFWWRRHYTMIKRKIFQVCNMLFININVPFIAVDLLSRFFQNVVATTGAGVRRCMRFLFNLVDTGSTADTHFDDQRVSEDDATMLFMVAANCLEIALNYHNGCARFDIFSLFYFLLFVDSIFSNVSYEECMDACVPSLMRAIDGGALLKQQLNGGRHYLRRSLKYHHGLFKRELAHLAREIKKNRILQVVNFQIVNCLEQLLLLSHGIFGLNLTLKVAPILFDVTQKTNRTYNLNVDRYEPNEGANSSRSGRMGFSGPREDGSCYNRVHSVRTNISAKPNCGPSGTLSTHRSTSDQLDMYEVDTNDSDDSWSSVPHSRTVSEPEPGPSQEESEFANSLVTESTELSILLLQMLSCSKYIEILGGNSMFASPGCGVDMATLMAGMCLHFVLDVYVMLTDDLISKALRACHLRITPVEGDAAGATYLEAFQRCMGCNYRLLAENNCALYFLVIELDWIFHKEGLYSSTEYGRHLKLMGSVLQLTSVFDRDSLEDAFEAHYRLYSQIAVMMFGGSHVEPHTSLCVEAFKERVASWSTFDEVTVRCVRPEDEMSINEDIMDIYYSDLRTPRACFNPYKSIFTPKYFALAKDLVYRVKAALLLYYIRNRRTSAR
ncbi:anaphase-promoting complex subunit CDC26, putative [Babesia ovata]|uniref:Anaphase-promoting complex subunit CDC26, putative n=1 Tax=Babesia ovata TaxID=189622 RepID=A0A2H6KH66_9APIC|nr:anaphase-promoting complex subunit CDC26, putative [Babesia ovata]GBE62326.1 anaphase-promoting complex subunit CDC26, putative [Babesia ovata]